METTKYNKITQVTFNFTCYTNLGDTVALVGNIPLLGHWDLQRAVQLNTTNNSYPVWSVRLDLPRDRIIEYKYVKFVNIPMNHKFITLKNGKK